MNKLAKAAIAVSGGQTDLAKKLGVSRPAVSRWLVYGFPVLRCEAIEIATEGRVHRKITRPDDWQDLWPELK